MVGEAGLEPATPGLEGRCSIQLSYSARRLAAKPLYRFVDFAQGLAAIRVVSRIAFANTASAQPRAASASDGGCPASGEVSRDAQPLAPAHDARRITRSARQQRAAICRIRSILARTHIST